MTEPEIAVAPLSITLFGPMRVLVEGRPLPRVRSRKALWLLALLASRQSRSVERDWLAGTLWPDVEREQALENLRPVLSDLRRVLGSQRERLQSPGRRTLFLDVAEADIDVVAFDAAIAARTLPALARAVSLYRGPLLEDCAEEWAGQERTARELDCVRALQTLAEAAAAAGVYHEAVGYLRRAAAMAPWQDDLRRSLMEALARGGDSNAALQVYREFRELLRSDPKAAPDEKTTALYTRLRAEARQESVPREKGGVATAAAPEVTGHLPHSLTGLVGREDERADVAAHLRASRLVTLTGPGGIGKTRLAIEVARDAVSQYADGVCLVGLETLTDGDRIDAHVAAALGLHEEAGRSLRESLSRHLQRKQRFLVVLDNCEHLLEASARLTGHLLRECPEVRILATSREALGITGETIWTVPSLPTPDPDHLPQGSATLLRVLPGYESVQLFIERSRAVRRTFELTKDNALSVARICAGLQGIPLAIELASARVRALTVEQIAARLDDHLSLLTGGSRVAMPRHQTFRAALDWSYDLLSEQERTLLARLSVFTGGCDLEAVVQVCAGGGIGVGQAADLLTGLVDKSLVVFEEDDRYRLLETVRQYASERLQASGEIREVSLRHRDHFLALAEEAEPHLVGPQPDACLRRLEIEYGNIRAAMAHCSDDSEAELRFAGVMWRFWYIRGDYTEGRRYLELALERAKDRAETPERAKALSGAAGLAYRQNDYPAALERFSESLSLQRKFGDIFGIGDSLAGLASVALSQGDHSKARTLYEQALSLKRECGHQQGVVQILNGLGTIAAALADLDTARALYREGLSLSREIGSRRGIGWALFRLCSMALSAEDYVTAGPMAEECHSLFAEIGERRGSMWALYQLSAVRMSQNRYESARTLAEESLASFREMGDRGGVSSLLNRLSEIEIFLGRYSAARLLLLENLPILRGMRNPENVAEALWLLAIATLALSEYEIGARLTGAADALHEKIGVEVPPAPRKQHTCWADPARTALGEEAFDAARAEGHSMSWEEAVAYALDLLSRA